MAATWTTKVANNQPHLTHYYAYCLATMHNMSPTISYLNLLLGERTACVGTTHWRSWSWLHFAAINSNIHRGVRTHQVRCFSRIWKLSFNIKLSVIKTDDDSKPVNGFNLNYFFNKSCFIFESGNPFKFAWYCTIKVPFVFVQPHRKTLQAVYQINIFVNLRELLAIYAESK